MVKTTKLNKDIKSQIERERILELALEGHRFWDLRKWALQNSDCTTKNGMDLLSPSERMAT